MTQYLHVRRRLATVLVLVIATAGLAVTTSPAAYAAPAPLSEPRDDEGGTKTLRDQLDEASRGYLEAQESLAASKKRKTELEAKLKTIDAELVVRQAAISEIVREAYRNGRLGPMTAMLNASSPDGFLDRAATLDIVAAKEDRVLRDLTQTRTAQEQAKIAIDAEIRNQQKQVTVMAKRKQQAESALKAAAAKVVVESANDTKPTANGSSSKASAAKRNSDGSLPNESCSVNDPTTSGCITPRTLHAMNEAKADGFTRFVSCYRPSGAGEHPKGRACDFASDKSGFGGDATGASKTYGDRLANYFIDNASRLVVLYVIWFRRIWLPSSGWKSYSGANGDPSSDHTNHVHLSVR